MSEAKESGRVKRRKQAQQNQAANKGSSFDLRRCACSRLAHTVVGTTPDAAFVLNTLTRRNLYHCNYCQKDISNTPRIKCAICPDFDLCLECFSVGVEINPHKNDHDYRVVDNLSFPIFHPDWGVSACGFYHALNVVTVIPCQSAQFMSIAFCSMFHAPCSPACPHPCTATCIHEPPFAQADEELLLLDAIDIYGMGNWAAVAEHVGPSKTPEQCKVSPGTLHAAICLQCQQTTCWVHVNSRQSVLIARVRCTC